MWTNLQETADLVTFTEEILDRKLHFLCCVAFINDGESFFIFELLHFRRNLERIHYKLDKVLDLKKYHH